MSPAACPKKVTNILETIKLLAFSDPFPIERTASISRGRSLPGGRRVRGFVGIEPLVHPCP